MASKESKKKKIHEIISAKYIYMVFNCHLVSGVEIQTSTRVENSESSQAPKISAMDLSADSANEKAVKKTENERSAVASPVDVLKTMPKIINVVPNSRTTLPDRGGKVTGFVFCFIILMSLF